MHCEKTFGEYLVGGTGEVKAMKKVKSNGVNPNYSGEKEVAE